MFYVAAEKNFSRHFEVGKKKHICHKTLERSQSQMIVMNLVWGQDSAMTHGNQGFSHSSFLFLF